MGQTAPARALSVIGGCVVCLATCCVAISVFAFGPLFGDRFVSTSIESACSSIKPGMTRDQTLESIRGAQSLDLETSSQNRLSFGRTYSVCVVEFEPQSGTVVRSSVQKPTVLADE